MGGLKCYRDYHETPGLLHHMLIYVAVLSIYREKKERERKEAGNVSRSQCNLHRIETPLSTHQSILRIARKYHAIRAIGLDRYHFDSTPT